MKAIIVFILLIVIGVIFTKFVFWGRDLISRMEKHEDGLDE